MFFNIFDILVPNCYNQYSDMPGSFGPTDTPPVGLDESNYSCTWFLLASAGKLAQIYITEMDTGKRNGCHSDYVEVGFLLTSKQ